jgi:hypothetical protein
MGGEWAVVTAIRGEHAQVKGTPSIPGRMRWTWGRARNLLTRSRLSRGRSAISTLGPMRATVVELKFKLA